MLGTYLLTKILLECGHILTMTPLLLTHIMIPPLDYLHDQGKPWTLSDTPRVPHPLEPGMYIEVEQLRDLYRLLPWQLRDYSYVQEKLLISSRDEHTVGYKNITHMFVHSTYQHAFANLSSAFVFARYVSQRLGIMATYAVFYGGGILSSLPVFIPRIEESLSKILPGLSGDFEKQRNSIRNSVLPEFMKGNNSVGQIITGMVDTAVTAMTSMHACGSSGGVCALMGCTTVVMLDDLQRAFWNVFSRPDDEVNTPARKLARQLDLFNCFINAVAIIQVAVKVLYHEEGSNYAITSHDEGNINDVNGSITAHAAHKKGVVIGGIAGFILARSML